MAQLEITRPLTAEQTEVFNEGARKFLIELQTKFNPRRKELLQRRVERTAEINAGKLPDFLESTREIRESDWRVAPIPDALLDRRVEITGPVERKMVINALNCGANVFMADFEDANSPTWENTIQGQVNTRDAVNGTIGFTSPEGKTYKLNDKIATLLVRPRGWHLKEKHVLLDGEPLSGSLFDFGLFFYTNASIQLANGFGPYFYLPKMESHLEARLWNDVFVFAQDYCGVPHGSVRATVLVDSQPA